MAVSKSAEPTVRPGQYGSVTTTRVLLWDEDNGTRRALDEFLDTCRRHGWRVQTWSPRTLEGPRFGALIIMQRKMPSVFSSDQMSVRRTAKPRVPVPSEEPPSPIRLRRGRRRFKPVSRK